MDNERYDRLIFDGARFIGELYKFDVAGMRTALWGLGADPIKINEVILAMTSPDYREDNYRGAMLDEGVVEAIKDVLRPIAGF